jgi:DNA repair protein RadC
MKKKYKFPVSSGLVAELTVGFNYSGHVMSRKISNSQDAMALVRELVIDLEQDCHRERFHIFLLNRNNAIKGFQTVSIGGMTGTVVEPMFVAQLATAFQVKGIIMIHNHPSGNLNASQQDIALTKKLKEALKLHEVILLEHIIYAPKTIEGRGVESVDDFGYYSFADEGLL